MQALTAYQMFSPIHVAWLHRRREHRLDVSSADLDSIEAESPDAINDPLFADYRSRANAGKLHRRRGRKPMSNAEYLRLWHARFEILDEVEAIHERRRNGSDPRMPGDLEPCFQAAETVARRMRLPMGGEWLVRKLSKAGIR